MQTIAEQPLDILLIEHEAESRQRLAKHLHSEGHRIAPFEDVSEVSCDAAYDLAFIPWDEPCSSQALARFHQRQPLMRFVLTHSNDGATEPDSGPEIVGYLRRPVPVEYATQFVRCVAELRAKDEELCSLRASVSQTVTPPVVLPRSTRTRRLVDRARQLAGEPTPVLLQGETGVGKCALASWIHQTGPCSDAPFILVSPSCGESWPPNELAGLLRQSKPRGTAVFVEIGKFSLALQGRILSLLEQIPTGDHQNDSLRQLRIIATSSEDLSHAAKVGKFREDLLSLLMDQSLYVPPLRERPEDIVALAEEMLVHFGRVFHRPGLSLEREAILALGRHRWPGNLHELRIVIERAAFTSKRNQIGESELHLRQTSESGCERAGEFMSLDALERQQILRVIRAAPTLEEAARILKVDISTLWRKRRRYGV